MGSAAAPAFLVAVIGLVGCREAAKPYSAAATVPCLRRQAAEVVRPSRAAARELRYGPHRVRVEFVGPSGSTIGLRAKAGDYQLVLYPSEDILYFHFARSADEASRLLRGYRSNLDYQLGRHTAERLVYGRRNVVVEWDEDPPSRTKREVVERCLLTKRVVQPAQRWRPAPQPRRFVGVLAARSLPLLELIPHDAVVVRTWRIPAGGGISPQVVIWWQRTALLSSERTTSGLVTWQRVGHTPRWRLVYSLGLPANSVSEVYARAGDVTGDGHADLLLFEYTGGSAGGGIYRLLANTDGRVRELFVRRGSFDDSRVRIRRGSLVMYDGLVRIHGHSNRSTAAGRRGSERRCAGMARGSSSRTRNGSVPCPRPSSSAASEPRCSPPGVPRLPV